MSHLLLLPNGEQTFVDANGVPYALGSVRMCIPNTLTSKNTWQDKDHSALNTDPITLDAAGRCVIWGEGTYRQILRDLNGNLVWDKETSVVDTGVFDASFLTVSDESTLLPNSRQLAAGAGIALADGGAGGPLTISSGAATFEPQGRLTPSTGVPLLSSAVLAATTLFYSPYKGNAAVFSDGSALSMETFTELSQLLSDATKSPAAAAAWRAYDVWLWEDGGTKRISRGPGWTDGGRTFTVTIASPGVFTLNNHGFFEGQPVVFTTTGALPTGLVAGTVYFVLVTGLTASAFQVSLTFGGAAVNTSGSQSGVHTATTYVQTRGTGAGSEEHDTTTFPGWEVNKFDITNGPQALKGFFLGTILTNASALLDMHVGMNSASGGAGNIIGIWNAYQQEELASSNWDTTASWNYTSTTYRMRNGSFLNAMIFVQGKQRTVKCETRSRNSNSSNMTRRIALMLNSSISSVTITGADVAIDGGNVMTNVTHKMTTVANVLGMNWFGAIEQSDATGTTTWSGDATNRQSLTTLYINA